MFKSGYLFVCCLFGVAVAQLPNPYNPYNAFRSTPAPLPPLAPLGPSPFPALAARTPFRSAESQAQILRQASDASPDGLSYSYSFETENGIQAEQSGVSVPIGRSADGQVLSDLQVRGSNQYVAPDGQVVITQYVADAAGGYQPQGSHIPRGPAIPPAILKSLQLQNISPEYLRAAGFTA